MLALSKFTGKWRFKFLMFTVFLAVLIIIVILVSQNIDKTPIKGVFI